MKTRVRPARAADAPRLTTIEAEANPNPWSAARLSELCQAEPASSSRGWVYEENDETCGFAFTQQVLDEVTLLNIAVASACRRRGLGASLLRAVLAEARASGATRCLLEVRRSNLPAIALYEGMGFALDGVREGYYRGEQGPEDAHLMSLELEESA